MSFSILFVIFFFRTTLSIAKYTMVYCYFVKPVNPKCTSLLIYRACHVDLSICNKFLTRKYL